MLESCHLERPLGAAGRLAGLVSKTPNKSKHVLCSIPALVPSLHRSCSCKNAFSLVEMGKDELFYHENPAPDAPVTGSKPDQPTTAPLAGRLKQRLPWVILYGTIILLLFGYTQPNYYLRWRADTSRQLRPGYSSISLNITHLFNNKAAGPGADFDPHSHGAYPAEYLPRGTFAYDRIRVCCKRT